MSTQAPASRLPLLASLQLLGLTFLLVGLGGSVTSKGAGMAVPDWPGTNGQFMLFSPFESLANLGMWLEHTHRLTGMAVGLAAIAVAVVNWHFSKSRPWLRWFGLMLLGCVVTQGLMGGFRVADQSRFLAAVHGVFGQITFALMMLGTCAWMPFWTRRTATPGSPSPLVRYSLAALTALPIPAIGLAAGVATLRHVDHTQTGEMQWHLARFLIPFGLCIAVTLAFAIKSILEAHRAPAGAPYAEGSRSTRTHAWLVLGLLLVQLCLGAAVRHWPAEYAVQGVFSGPKSQQKMDAEIARLEKAAPTDPAAQIKLDRYKLNMTTDAHGQSRLPAAKIHTHLTHQTLGCLIGLISIGWLVVLIKRHKVVPVPLTPRLFFGLAFSLQIALGIFTVLSGVHWVYATCHQTVGALLLAATVLLTCYCVQASRTA